MKKILFVFIALVTCWGLIGCSSGSETLAEDEYYIYENNKVIFALTDIDWESSTNKPFSFSNPIYYLWDGHPEIIEVDDTKIYDFTGKELSTKRGLAIGDTFRQFADKYSNVEMGLPDYNMTITPSELLSNQQELNIADTFIIKDTTYFSEDGTPKDRYEDVMNGNYYEYTIIITFEYNTVIDIEIDYFSSLET